MHNEPVRRDDSQLGRGLQLITGWALLIAAAGMFFDAWAGSNTVAENGSIGLIPAYLGFITGMICFVFVVSKVSGTWPGMVTGAGVVGMFVFWGSYPDHSTIGGLGTIVVGIAVLWLPGWARFTSPLWVASGVMGITELVRPGVHWGPITGFTLGGAAVAATGVFVLRGLPTTSAAEPSMPGVSTPVR